MNNPRSYESHMEWEYQGSGPQDPSSPFTHAAKKGTSSGFGGFSSPSKASSRPNPFANLPGTPSSKPLPQLPRASVFTPQISSKATAPPFRNPAFTTPRRPVDEVIFSEASGAEDSPGNVTEMSDMPNDTPEVDHMGDVAMGGMLSPSRIDKSSRYGKTGSQKKHTPGKGEIRSRSPIKGALMRKRKRHNLDKDVGSVVRYQLPDSDDSEDDSESSKYSRGRRSRSKTRRDEPRGFFGSIFHMLDEHPNAPDNLHRWIQLGLNLVFISTILGIGWSIYATIRSDILNANSAARDELRAEIFQCQRQFDENDCRNTKAPALKAICQQWSDCMLQNPDTVMRVKVTIKQIAEIINEFSEAMNFKAWGFFFGILIVCILSNNLLAGRTSHATAPAAPNPSGPVTMGDDPSVMWMPVATPRMKRQMMLEEAASDTDATPPPKMQPMLAYTPSSRRSPSKGERAMSPVKSQRSPSKRY